MTTKSQDFANTTARSGKKKPKQPKPSPKRARGGGQAATRNESAHAGSRGGAVLEESAGKASRKSSRKSVDHTKRTTNQQLKAQRKSTAPSTRAARGR
jgi:hypothetical protein